MKGEDIVMSMIKHAGRLLQYTTGEIVHPSKSVPWYSSREEILWSTERRWAWLQECSSSLLLGDWSWAWWKMMSRLISWRSRNKTFQSLATFSRLHLGKSGRFPHILYSFLSDLLSPPYAPFYKPFCPAFYPVLTQPSIQPSIPTSCQPTFYPSLCSSLLSILISSLLSSLLSRLWPACFPAF
jgi:hypothetical protein